MLCFGEPSDVGSSAARSRSSRLLTAKERHVAHVLGEPFDSSQIGRATLQTGSRRGSWKTERAAEAESSLTGTVGCCCCQFSRWTVGVSVLVRTVSYGKNKRRSQMLMLLIQAPPPPAAVLCPCLLIYPDATSSGCLASGQTCHAVNQNVELNVSHSNPVISYFLRTDAISSQLYGN